MNISWIIAGYFLVGLVVLVVFDLLTKRIRNNFRNSAYDAKTKLAGSGNYIGDKQAFFVMAGVTYLFWPFVIIGAMTGKNNAEKDGCSGKEKEVAQGKSSEEERPAE